jgi:hypothetical protein
MRRAERSGKRKFAGASERSTLPCFERRHCRALAFLSEMDDFEIRFSLGRFL